MGNLGVQWCIRASKIIKLNLEKLVNFFMQSMILGADLPWR